MMEFVEDYVADPEKQKEEENAEWFDEKDPNTPNDGVSEKKKFSMDPENAPNPFRRKFSSCFHFLV